MKSRIGSGRGAGFRAIAALVAAIAVGACAGPQRPSPRAYEDSYPVVVVPRAKFDAVRTFYMDALGLEAVFDSTWFVGFGTRGDGSIAVAVMAEDHPSAPPGPQTYGGEGVLLTLQVADAAAAEKRLRGGGVVPEHPLSDEPWGQRRFMVRDPAGLAIDIVETIAPKEGFWQPYLRPAPGP